MPGYAQLIVIILALAVLYSAGRGIYNRVRYGSPAAAPVSAGGSGGNISSGASSQPSAWQTGVMLSLDASLREAQAGNIDAAEVDADRAASILQSARMQAISAAGSAAGYVPASTAFFASADDTLERVILAKPDNDRLAEHARLAEITLAELRSSRQEVLAGGPLTLVPDDSPEGKSSPSGEVRIVAKAPRAIGANYLLNPASLGGNVLDATSMPFSAEIIEPPSTRAFADNIRVENLDFSGAAQTLDGIHWHHVVFIGTRLRYEGGQVSLQNVQFIRCTFGFTTDARGARLANAIALGQTSLVIE